MAEYNFLIKLIEAVGFPAVIFIIWYLYHKSQVEFFKRILEESANREERNYKSLQELVETLHGQLSIISRIEYKIDTGYTCPMIKKGYAVRVVSTPAGKSGKFYELWDDEDNEFSRHKIDIYQAVKEGCNIDIEAFRKSMDAESFAQEFECVFVDEAWSYFPMELIQSAVSAECDSWDGVLKGQMYLGIDIGRKKDLTVIAAAEKLHETSYIREIKTLQGKTFAEQRQAIEDMKETLHPLRICIDASGLGMQLAEELKAQYGSVIEPVGFTAQVKEDLVTKSRILFEKGLIKIPQDMDLIRDIHSIKKTVTVAGNVRFDADRTEAGHADRFWAMALAIHAGMKPSGLPYVVSRKRHESADLMRGF